MISKIRVIDDKIVETLQNAYLWLLDRTGVYLATCCVVLILASAACQQVSPSSSYSTKMVSLVCSGILCLMQVRSYILQMMAMHVEINAGARAFRYHIVRPLYFSAILPLIVLPPYELESILGVALGAVAVGYGPTIQIREREPKTFFESALTPATSEAQ